MSILTSWRISSLWDRTLSSTKRSSIISINQYISFAMYAVQCRTGNVKPIQLTMLLSAEHMLILLSALAAMNPELSVTRIFTTASPENTTGPITREDGNALHFLASAIYNRNGRLFWTVRILPDSAQNLVSGNWSPVCRDMQRSLQSTTKKA